MIHQLSVQNAIDGTLLQRLSGTMTDDAGRRILVKRPRKVSTDGRKPSAWVDPAASTQLELVSTQMLKVMLSSRDKSNRKGIEKAANTAAEGVLARNPSNGQFEIIEDDDLQAILNGVPDLPKLSRPADATVEPLRDYVDDDHLSLVSMKALRKVLDDDGDAENDPVSAETESRSFNPYNKY